MRRPYPDRAYDPAPPPSYWAATVPEAAARRTPLESDLSVEVAIIGGGYTGLNAALALAERGAEAAVFDAAYPGWGASGRNGGFVCLGGAAMGYAEQISKFGEAETRRFVSAQRASVDHVGGLLERFSIDADRHSDGEWALAHSARTFARMGKGAALDARLGLPVERFTREALAARGVSGPTIHGGWRVGCGFAINPLKYAHGLAKAVEAAGPRLFTHSPVHAVERAPGGFRLHVGGFSVRARKLIVGANGYVADDWIPGLNERALPVMSSIVVTRPISESERRAQGWTSDQAVYDTRSSVHYFRMLPEGRFLFGVRGGSSINPRLMKRLTRRIRADFERMFPAWEGVGFDYQWNGLLALTRDRHLSVGPLGDWSDAWTGFGYHGNGVAMGSYVGKLLAELAAGDRAPEDLPAIMRAPLRPFPLPRLRMLYIKGAYAAWDLAEAVRG